MIVREYICTGRFARWMRKGKWTGVTIPLPFLTLVLYWAADEEENWQLRWAAAAFPCAAFTAGAERALAAVAHERAHVRQVWQRGWFRWWVVWWREIFQEGYRQNDLEEEAYDAQKRAREGGNG